MNSYKIYNFKNYKTNNKETRENNAITGNIDFITQLLENNKAGYHEITQGNNYLILHGDLDFKSKKEANIITDYGNILIREINNMFNEKLELDDLKYTENNGKVCKKTGDSLSSYHWTIPKICMVKLEQKNFLKKIHNDNYKEFSKYGINVVSVDKIPKDTDDNIYKSDSLFRLPNQLKEMKENTEHTIKNGTMKDFITQYIEDSKKYEFKEIIEEIQIKKEEGIKKIYKNENKNNDNVEIEEKIIKLFIEKCFSYNRCDDYNEWINVGICFKNSFVYETALKLFNDFSKKSSKYQDYDETKKVFDGIKLNSRERELTKKSLYYWAKHDNINEYKIIMGKIDFLNIGNDYNKIKEEFEILNFIILNTTEFAEIDEQDEYYNLIIRKKTDLLVRYAPLTYIEYSIKDGEIKSEEKSFINKWINDKNRRSYKSIDFLPNKNCNDDIFNTFKCLKAETLNNKYPDITEEYVNKLINNEIDNNDRKHLDILQNHIKNLCGNDEKIYFYLVQWLAFMVQQRKQPMVALVFQSKDGVGKDLFWAFIYDFIIGRKMVSVPSDLSDVIGRFTGTTLENKLLVHINEVSGKDTFAGNDKIKALIAGQKIIKIENKNEKGRDITNNLGFVFLSNNENPVRITESDRRFCAIECSNEWVEKKSKERFEYFNKLADILSNNQEHAERLAVIFYNVLNTMPLNEFEIKNIPKSDLYNKMKKEQLHPINYWFKSIWEDMESKGKSKYECKAQDFYNEFIEWKNKYGFSKFELNLTKFGGKIKDFEFIKKKKNNCFYYTFEITDLIDFLKSKNLYEEDIFTDE